MLLSLLATIKKFRPDLLPGHEVITQPIPEEMPPQYRNKVLKRRMVEGVGEPTTACFLQAVDTDPTNWYLIPPDNICLVQMLEDNQVAV